LKELLDQAKEEKNAVLEQSHQLEQMRLELEALHARNAELEAKCAPPPAIKGDEKKPPHTLQDLTSKKFLTERVDNFLEVGVTPGGGGIEARPGTKQQCSHDLQSGQPKRGQCCS